MNEEARIIQLYKDLYTAMINKDAEALETLMEPFFIITHITTANQDRQSFINDIKSGKLTFFSAEQEDFNMRIIGNSAWLIAKTSADAELFGTERKNWRLQMKAVLRLTEGEWRFTEARMLVC